MVWLGLEKHQEDWTNREQTEGDFCVFAETVSTRETTRARNMEMGRREVE